MNILYIAPYTSSSFRTKHGDINTPSLGGLRKLELIVMALTKAGHSVVILSSAMLSISRLALRSEACEAIDLECGGTFKVIYPPALMLRPLGGFVNCLRVASYVRKIIDQYSPDAAIVYNTYLFESLATRELLRSNKIPICLEIEDLPLARKRGLFNLKPLMDQFCWNSMLEKASSYLTVNKYIFDKLSNDKLKTLLPGIIHPELVELSRLRLTPFTNQHKILGYFGALTPEKGVNVLLELIPRLESPWRLVVTGSGPLSTEFTKLSKRYPERFEFMGLVSEHQLYKNMCSCDCVVIPLEKISDGGQGVFPFKTLEYLVSGAHIISTNLASQNKFDLSFIQRWDGKLSSLLNLLFRAEQDYNNEYDLRTATREYVINRFGLSGIEKILNKHLYQ